MRELLHVIRRETGAYFGSPVAYLFVGAFLAVTLFVFFWAEAFFARGIADVQPLFEWMPILLIALVAALTMRSWSEERRSGTLEVLLSAPVAPLALVGGKFLAALSLVALSLLLTLPLPLTAEFLGPLDWGPVIGGYVATLFLAAAYVAIGLFVSARTDNQIVSLIVTGLIGGAFFVIGSDWLTALAPQPLAEIMRLVGTGSRFEEITRGVLDLRDIYYYISLVALFLALNVYALEQLRWADEHTGAHRHAAWRVAVGLVAVNFLVANLWLQPIATARADITADNRYSLSEATRSQLGALEEPLMIRGYFSRKTHPLLETLVPQMRDMLKEYEVIGGDGVRVAFVDPQQDRQVAQRAREQFGIEPVPLRTANRYESSVVSAYFHVLIKYGDQTKVLDFRDLIEIKRSGATDISVALRNPEYQITRSIRTVARKYRSGGDPLASLDEPVTFHGYVSAPERLPDRLDKVRESLHSILEEMQTGSGGKLRVEFEQPLAGDGKLAERLQSEYGFRPMVSSLLSDRRFYFYMVLQQGEQTVPVELPASLKEKELREAIEAGLESLGGGFRRTVAVYRPQQDRMAQLRQGGGHRELMRTLRGNAAVIETQLKDGRVPSRADLLLLLGPRSLDEKQRFAVDQFLMRGGSVVVAASPMDVQVSRMSGVQVDRGKTGLESWLAQYGVEVRSRLVLDPHSGNLTLPVRSNGGVRMQTLDYPYFIDVREQGLADVPMLENLRQVTLAWTSPVRIDPDKAGELDVTRLIRSSARAWTSSGKTIMPDYQRYPQLGFEQPEQRGRQTLAVMLEGRFQSAYKDRPSPLQEDDEADRDAGASEERGGKNKQTKQRQQQSDEQPTITSVIEHSPPGSRLVVLGSSSALSDAALRIVRRSTGTEYAAPLTLVQNLADWSLGDPALLAIRSGSQYSRLLRPVGDGTQAVLEAANYGFALGGLGLIFLVRRAAAGRRRAWFRQVLDGEVD